MGKLISLIGFLRVPLLALALVLAGGGLLYLTIPNLLNFYRSQTWPRVTGQIVESRWQNKLIAQSAARPSFKFIPKIEYSYTVGEKEFKGNTVSLSAFDEMDRSFAKTKLEQYPTGRQVLVYFNPSQPELSCLEQEKPSLGSLLGIIAGIVAFYTAFVVLKSGSQTQPTLTLSTSRYSNEGDFRAALKVFAKDQRR